MSSLTRPNTAQDYKPFLVQFMNFKDAVAKYTTETEFTQEQLLAVKPLDVKQWLSLKVYGTRDLGLKDKPVEGQVALLQHYLKGLSYYMPQKGAWHEKTQSGNPANSGLVNEFVGRAMQQERQLVELGERSKRFKPGLPPASSPPREAKRRKVMGPQDSNYDTAAAGPSQYRADRHYFSLMSEISVLKSEQAKMRDQLTRTTSVMTKQLRMLQQSMNRLVPPPDQGPAKPKPPPRARPAAPPRPPPAARGTNHRLAILSKNPKTLMQLWDEYQVGIDGNKAAKDFTSQEKSQYKGTYIRRKAVWATVEELIQNGHTPKTAIDLIQKTYNDKKTISALLDQLRKDRSVGRHPDLRV